jgi:formylmethanofuran:tetrahydromethanopterin formyltransferase
MASTNSMKHALVAAKPSHTLWHSRLGHPSLAIVRQILSKHKLPCVRDSSIESVCDYSQRVKSHQLPYHISTSVSTGPLKLVFSDVWGLAPASVGRHVCQFY